MDFIRKPPQKWLVGGHPRLHDVHQRAPIPIHSDFKRDPLKQRGDQDQQQVLQGGVQNATTPCHEAVRFVGKESKWVQPKGPLTRQLTESLQEEFDPPTAYVCGRKVMRFNRETPKMIAFHALQRAKRTLKTTHKTFAITREVPFKAKSQAEPELGTAGTLVLSRSPNKSSTAWVAQMTPSPHTDPGVPFGVS